MEGRDFSFGTSSRSSKLVHGGFRYLRNRQFDVTRESVREREWMLREAQKMVQPLPFLLPSYEGAKTPSWQFSLGVVIYDLMAPKWDHRSYSARGLQKLCPLLNSQGLTGGHLYYDARMDDSRLVLRVIREAVRAGGTAINYARAESLLKTADGQVCGAVVRDTAVPNGRTAEVRAKVVVNAAGPWSDELRAQVGGEARLRKCRGSHLIFSYEKFPIQQAVTLLHPKDNRAMFAIPWEGTTMIGTTDLDQCDPWEHAEPYASQAEVEYILDALHATFPSVTAGEQDIISSFAGLRPLISSNAALPSQVSRKHVIWDENGLLTITGGKLTIFRIMAHQVLEAAAKKLPAADLDQRVRMFDPLPALHEPVVLDPDQADFLLGRYGAETPDLIASAHPGEFDEINPLPNLWAELRWSARAEGVVHLDDLLLRRVRLGMLLPEGAAKEVEKIRAIVQPELGWADAAWDAEWAAYQETWRRYYAPVPVGSD